MAVTNSEDSVGATTPTATVSKEESHEKHGLKKKVEAIFKSTSNNDGRVIGAEYKAPGRDEEEPLEKDAQAGVQGVQATTTVWHKWHMIAAYVL